MANKAISIGYKTIITLSDVRLSPSCFYVDAFFNKFQGNVKTLEELDADISSGSYIDTYL